MINKERWGIAFFVILALLDQFISLKFPVDFTFSSVSFVPHFCFVGCMLMFNSQKLMNRILYSCLCGLCYGLFFGHNWLFEMILFTVFGLVLGLFHSYFVKDNRLLFAGMMISILLYDCFGFTLAYIMKRVTMTFIQWFIHVELFTLVLHILIVLALIYVITVFFRYSTIKDIRYKKIKKRKMIKLKRK